MSSDMLVRRVSDGCKCLDVVAEHEVSGRSHWTSATTKPQKCWSHCLWQRISCLQKMVLWARVLDQEPHIGPYAHRAIVRSSRRDVKLGGA